MKYLLLICLSLVTLRTNACDQVCINQQTLAEQFQAVIEENDVEKLEALFCTTGLNVNYEFAQKNSILHCVCHRDEYHLLVKLLLDKGAAVDKYNQAGYTPLLYAVINNCPIITKLLLDYNAAVNSLPNIEGPKLSPLSHALELFDHYARKIQLKKNPEKTLTAVLELGKVEDILTALKKRGARAVAQDYEPVFFKHLLMQDQNKIRTCARLGFDVNKEIVIHFHNGDHSETHSYTPLRLALQQQYSLSCIRTLLESGAQADSAFEHEQSLMHVAVKTQRNDSKSCKIVQLLLEHGAQVDRSDCNKFTPLHFVCDTRTAEILIAAGACVNARSARNITPLHMAASRGFCSIAELLLKHKAQVNAVDAWEHTPLYQAIGCSDLETVKLLLLNGARVDDATIRFASEQIVSKKTKSKSRAYVISQAQAILEAIRTVYYNPSPVA